MTQQLNLPARPGAAHADPALGQIPFRLRIGIAGHQDLPDDPTLGATVRGQLSELIDQLQHREPTGVCCRLRRIIGRLRKKKPVIIELAVISRLGRGADRLVVEEVRELARQHQQRARLEVVLPMHRDVYPDSQNWDAATRAEFHKYLGQASHIVELHHAADARARGGEAHDSDGRAYEAAGRRLIASCDIVLALWDGQKTDQRGGAAETLLEAASLRKPCVWIATGPGHQVTDNFGRDGSWRFQHAVLTQADMPPSRARPPLEPEDLRKPDEDVLTPLRESLKLLNRYNGERLPAKFGDRLRGEFNYPDGEERWIAPYFLRATLLAGHYQTLFTRLAWAITVLAITAAAVLGVHLTLNSSSAWDWAEVASLLAITVIFLVLNRGEFHDRWISYRSLAERLRSARFLIPVGVDFPRFRPTATAYARRNPSDWIQRTFDEFSQSQHGQGRESPRREDNEGALRQRLAGQWIEAQIAYHGKRYKEHHRWQRVLLATILVLFAAAVISAILDASAVSRSVTGFLSVLLPAAAASLGVMLTVGQHRQLAERSHQLSNDLQEAQWQINHADDRGLLVSAAAWAAGIMAAENDDWLGALWFLDVEHPG